MRKLKTNQLLKSLKNLPLEESAKVKVSTSAVWGKTTMKTTVGKTPRKSPVSFSTSSKKIRQSTWQSLTASTQRTPQKCFFQSWVFFTKEFLAQNSTTAKKEISSNTPCNLRFLYRLTCSKPNKCADPQWGGFHLRSSFQDICPRLSPLAKTCPPSPKSLKKVRNLI